MRWTRPQMSETTRKSYSAKLNKERKDEEDRDSWLYCLLKDCEERNVKDYDVNRLQESCKMKKSGVAVQKEKVNLK